MEAWSFVQEWWRHFGRDRILHGTTHDALFVLPGIGDYFRRLGVIPASPESISAAFAAGHDAIVWPGGELDAFRPWTKRDQVVLGGRSGFVRQAITSGVPIVPVAATGGPDAFEARQTNARRQDSRSLLIIVPPVREIARRVS
jgi:1-acyl-sn-glycerol-3-phosphate acyltransferase